MAVEPKEYTKLAAEIMAVRAKKETPLAMVRTYGCQQNVSDGEKIKGMLQQMGFGFTEDQEEADFILFNTCAIREHAEDRIFGNVGALKYLKRRNPSLIIALCGCMMEQEHVVERIRKSYPFVSLVFGTHSLSSFPQLVYETLTGAKRVFQRGGEDTIDENIPVRRDGRFKAWLPVMYGCDNFCSYCVVPYVRGRERSREPEAVLKEARQLIEGGYKDITLLGQNVNSYGKNLPEPVNFAKLLKEISDMEGDYWLRFMTSHPKDASQKLFDTMASSPKIAPCFHLPFQAGNDRILKAMNRVYDRAGYLDKVRRLRQAIPDVVITSDVIVGFPGETEEDFRESCAFLKEIGFLKVHVFPYSRRSGTPAYDFPDQVHEREKQARSREMNAIAEDIRREVLAGYEGSEDDVLLETPLSGTLFTGYTRLYVPVVVSAPGHKSGEIVHVRLGSYDGERVRAEMV